jgi:hypothetical protein
MWPHEQGGQPEYKAIEGGQVRGTLSGAAANQQLMLERQGFRGNGAHAARTEEFRQRDKQMCRQKNEVAHDWKVVILVASCKTAKSGRLHLELWDW